jgi:hypothetical protein
MYAYNVTMKNILIFASWTSFCYSSHFLYIIECCYCYEGKLLYFFEELMNCMCTLMVLYTIYKYMHNLATLKISHVKIWATDMKDYNCTFVFIIRNSKCVLNWKFHPVQCTKY